MKRNKVWFLSFLLIGTLFLGFMGTVLAAPKGVLRCAITVPARAWNPHTEQAAVQILYYNPVYEGLVGEAPDGSIIPQLATKWEWAPNAITFTLRENVLFHDGAKFNAEAVKVNIEDNKTANPANAAMLGAIESVDVLDETHVRFRLNKPAPNLLYNLQRFPGFMVSPSALKSDVIIRRPVGTGPWKFDPDKSIKDVKYVYVLNDKYYDPSVQGLEGIIINVLNFEQQWNAFQAGETDTSQLVMSFIPQAKAAGYQIVAPEGPHWAMNIFDRPGKIVPEFKDPRVRRAISHAIDREAIFKVVQGGIPCTQRYLPSSPWHAKNIENLEYNLDTAKKLMADAGVKGFSFDVFAQDKAFEDVSEAVAGMLKKINITMNIKKIAIATLWSEAASGKWAATILVTFERHPLDYYNARIAPNGNLNPFKNEDKEIDALAQKALATQDEKSGNQIWADALRLEAERGYHIHLGSTEFPIAVNQKKVKNMRAYTLAPATIYFRGITME